MKFFTATVLLAALVALSAAAEIPSKLEKEINPAAEGANADQAARDKRGVLLSAYTAPVVAPVAAAVPAYAAYAAAPYAYSYSSFARSYPAYSPYYSAYPAYTYY